MKALNIIVKVLFCLVLLMPILGATGIFGAPTADMYNTPQAFSFIQTLMDSWYINFIMAVVALAALILILMKRTALAALLMLPIIVNILAFHIFLDGGLFTAGAVLAWVIAVPEVYLLWKNRGVYKNLWYARS